MPERPYIGGQAVLEGVMMRAPTSFAVVVRRKDGTLHVRERAMRDTRKGIVRWPLVRGVASLVESLRLGSEALRFSVEQMEKDWLAEEARKNAPAGPGLGIFGAFGLTLAAMVSAADGEQVSAGGGGRKAGTGLMLLVAIAFFIALPQ